MKKIKQCVLAWQATAVPDLQALLLLDDFGEWQLEPSSVTYSAAVNACALPAWEWAMALVQHGLGESLQANILVYNACISAAEKGPPGVLCDGKGWDFAVRISTEDWSPHISLNKTRISGVKIGTIYCA